MTVHDQTVAVVLFLWFAATIVAAVIGDYKNRPGLGFLLGIILGWIGVIIIAVLERQKTQQERNAETARAAMITAQAVDAATRATPRDRPETVIVKIRCGAAAPFVRNTPSFAASAGHR